jgi:glutamate:GABA antiporter
MGFWDVVLFLVAAVVGLRWIAVAAAAGPSSLVVWAIAFVAFFLPLAFGVVELSARFPEEGGIYVWTKQAFGELAGFMTGWLYWASNVFYIPSLLTFSASNALFIGGSRWQALQGSDAYFMVTSIAGVVLATALNIVGLGVGKWLPNAGAVGTWIPVLALLALAGVAWASFGVASGFGPAALVPSVDLKNMIFWSSIAFAFAGLETASLMSEEIRDPGRTIRRAIVAGGAAITAIYMLGTAAVLVALPRHQVSSLAGIMQAVSQTCARAGVPALAPVIAALIALGGLGGVGAWLASTARLPFVAGVDRFLPPAFGRLHPRYGTPHVALLVQAVGAALFAVLGHLGTDVKGAYDALVGITVIVYFIPYLFLFAALFKLGARPSSRVLAVLGFAVTAISIVLAAVPAEDSPHPALAVVKVVGSSVALVVVGAVLYFTGTRRRRVTP